MISHVIEGLGHVLHAKIGDAHGRDAILLFHHGGEIHGGAGTLHDIESRAMGPLQIRHPTITGDIGHHLHTYAGKIVADHPDLTGQVEVAKDIDRKRGDGGGVTSTDEAGHGITRGGVTGPFISLKAL